jgi:hypothetical protein
VSKGRILWLAFSVVVASLVGYSVTNLDSPTAVPTSVPVLTSLPAPYSNVRWAHLNYPGLDCGQLGVVLDRVAEVPVSTRTGPLALADVSCNINHLYTNLYVFDTSFHGASPRLVQRLTPAGNASLGIGMKLSIATNEIELLAGAGFRGLGCPTTAATYRWAWDGDGFAESPSIPVLSATMPNLVGSTLPQAVGLTMQAGIPSCFSVNASALLDNPRTKVTSQVPKPGAQLHSPFPDDIRVW